MMTLRISEKDYNVKFGYNNFCDSDLLERVEEMMQLLNGAKTDKDVSSAGRMKELFVLIRELLFEGFKKENPVESLQDVGNLLDTYLEETPEVEDGEEPEQRGVLTLFILLSNELMSEGFLADLMTNLVKMAETVNKSKVTKMPQDRKTKAKK